MYIKSLHNELGEIVKKLKDLERDKEMFSMLLRGGIEQIDLDTFPKLKEDGIVEKRLVNKVNPTILTGLRIAGVDGGVVSRLYHAIDIILTKAAAVIFDFSQDKPIVRYYPADVPPLNVLVNYIPVSRTEIETSSSLERAIEEVKTAIGVLDYAKIDILCMDGSIYPQHDIFTTSTIAARGELLTKFYEKLY